MLGLRLFSSTSNTIFIWIRKLFLVFIGNRFLFNYYMSGVGVETCNLHHNYQPLFWACFSVHTEKKTVQMLVSIETLITAWWDNKLIRCKAAVTKSCRPWDKTTLPRTNGAQWLDNCSVIWRLLNTVSLLPHIITAKQSIICYSNVFMDIDH